MTNGDLSIFVIDDDSIVCYILKKQIEHFEGCSIWGTATDGEEALQMLKECAQVNRPFPQLILLDLNMPVINGWQFLDRLQQDADLAECKSHICVLSSSIDEEDKERSAKYDCVSHFYAKPLLDADIQHLMESLKAKQAYS